MKDSSCAKKWKINKDKQIHLSLSGRTKQSVTEVACWEKIEKFIPFSTSDTPNGNAWPGKIFHDDLVFIISELSSCNCNKILYAWFSLNTWLKFTSAWQGRHKMYRYLKYAFLSTTSINIDCTILDTVPCLTYAKHFNQNLQQFLYVSLLLSILLDTWRWHTMVIILCAAFDFLPKACLLKFSLVKLRRVKIH